MNRVEMQVKKNCRNSWEISRGIRKAQYFFGHILACGTRSGYTVRLRSPALWDPVAHEPPVERGENYAEARGDRLREHSHGTPVHRVDQLYAQSETKNQ